MGKQGRPRTFKLTEKEQQALKMAEQHCQDGQTCMRYQAVRLYGRGYPVAEIQAITGCSVRRLSGWCAYFRREGVVGLVDKRVGGNRAKLTADQIETVQTTMHRYTPNQKFGVGKSVGGQFWTLADVRRLVKETSGIVFHSATSYRTLMHTCDMSFQKTQGVYKNRSAQKVAEFEEAFEKNCWTLPSGSRPR
jgi:transposase